jgi:hypothetical protein
MPRRGKRAIRHTAERRSLEEHLRHAHDQVALTRDVLALYACGMSHMDDGLSADAANALSAACRTTIDDLRALLATLPTDLLNWPNLTPARMRRR